MDLGHRAIDFLQLAGMLSSIQSPLSPNRGHLHKNSRMRLYDHGVLQHHSEYFNLRTRTLMLMIVNLTLIGVHINEYDFLVCEF